MGSKEAISWLMMPAALSSTEKTISSSLSSESTSEMVISSTGGLVESDLDFGDVPTSI